MAPPRKNSVAVATMPGRNGGTLRRGNPGNRGGTGRPTDAFVLRARHLLEQAQGLELLARVIEGKEMEPRFVDRRKVTDGQGGVQTVTEIVYAPPTNRQKIEAVVRLAELGRLVPHTASPTPGDPDEPQVRWIVVLPKRARTTKEWLAMHKLNKA